MFPDADNASLGQTPGFAPATAPCCLPSQNRLQCPSLAQEGPLLDLPPGFAELGTCQPAALEPTPAIPIGLQGRDAVTLPHILRLVQVFQNNPADAHQLPGVDLEHLRQLMPDPAFFTAAAPQQAAFHWHEYFRAVGSGPHTPTVLRWMSEGYKPPWVHPYSAPQQAHPKFKENLAVVRQQVAQVVGRSQVASYIDRDTPGHIHFPNRKSALDNPAFVQQELQQAVQRGVLRPCNKEDLHVISGLGVVGDVTVKGRLILNAMYLNLFCKYKAFHYEALADVQVLAHPGDVIMVTDFKSGYHHVPLHPSVHRFFGIEYQGQYYCFTVLPFGLASGCYVFTLVASEVMRPLILRGLRCLKYIDDIAYFIPKGPTALVVRAMIISVFAYLRLFLSPAKCALDLGPAAPILGLICDVEHRKFLVPALKAQALRQAIADFKTSGGSKRALAQLVGKLVAIAPAVQLAPLYSRRLFQAITDTQEWDQQVGSQERALAEEDLLYFDRYLETNPGWGWAPRPSVAFFECAGDASNSGYGGHSQLLTRDLALPFSATDQRRMQHGQFSSTEREVKNVCILVTACIKQDPVKVAGSTIVCLCDNQGAVANVNNLRGSPQEVQAIRDMWVTASAADVQVKVEWRPRDTAAIKRADALSRVRDSSDYALSYTLTHQLFQRWGCPTGDAFAGPWGHAHKAKLFFTATPSHVGVGFDATIQDWALLGPFVWVFPPVWLIRQAVAKILMHQCKAIFLVPAQGLHHLTLIQQLPIQDSWVIQPHDGMFQLGSHFPPQPEGREFKCRVHCYLVDFTKHIRPTTDNV